MRGREISYGQRQGGGRGWEPAEVVVRGRGQVLLGEAHRTAAVAEGRQHNNAPVKIHSVTESRTELYTFIRY